MRGFVLGRSRYPPKRSGVAEGDVNQGCGTLLGEADCTGLAPDGVYVYAERGGGRRNRPLSQGEHGCPKQNRTLEGKPAQSKPQYTNIQREAKPVGKSGNGIARSMI